jgi:hypothetical protein
MPVSTLSAGSRLRELGFSVLADTAVLPGLVAAVDQHAAAVRESVAVAGGLRRSTLTWYVHGLADGLRSRGWTPPERGQRHGYDWEALRLAAICWVAREHGLLA